MTQPLELWTAATPNGWKVSIMIEELRELEIALPSIEVITVDIMNGEQFSDAFNNVSANQKIPGLVHGGIKLMESCAILQYLAERHPTTLLALDEGRWAVLPWVYWQAANVGPVFGNKLSYTRYLDQLEDIEKHHPLERFGNEALRLVRVLDSQLGDSPWVCGEQFTIADISLYPWLRGYKWSKVDITTRPRVLEWVHRVRARPAVARGLAYGVPEDEIDSWSKDRRTKYAKSGASIADNASIAGRGTRRD